jgi:hypothetical protein
MNSHTLCGTAATTDGRMAWPFHRTIALGYYDGPTNGVIECANCSGEFRFDLLDVIWNAPLDVPRIFSLAPLPEDSLDRLAAVCPQHEWPPDWSTRPCWCPHWQFPLAAEQEAAHRQVQEILDLGAAPEWVVAWCVGQEERDIAAAKRLTHADSLYIQRLLSLCPEDRPPLELDPSERRDWFAFLGLERPASDGHEVEGDGI